MVKENYHFSMNYASFNFLSLLVQFSPKNDWSQLQVPLIVQSPLPLHVVAGSQNTMNRRNDSYFSSVTQWAFSTSVTFPYYSQNFIYHHLKEDSKHFWELKWNSILHCSMILNYRGIEIMLYQFPMCDELKMSQWWRI